MREPPLFGTPPGEACLDRPSAYGIARDGEGRVLCVRAKSGLHLPGGGVHLGESATDAVVREFVEEAALAVAVDGFVGEANQYVGRFRKLGSFFRVTLAPPHPPGDPSHEPVWVTPEDAARQLLHGFHRWAVLQAQFVKVELFGIARARAGRAEVQVEAATLGEALAQLAARCPSLAGEVVRGERLTEGWLASLNGERFVAEPGTPVSPGDTLLVLGAQAGG
mgnify:CR=1 FL=1